MAIAADDVGTGTTAVFGTSSFAMNVTNVSGGDMTRAVIDSTHMGTTGERTKIFGDLFDPGSIELELALDPEDQPPITFPSTATLAGTGATTAWSWNSPLEDKMTATMTFTWDGETGPTWTTGA